MSSKDYRVQRYEGCRFSVTWDACHKMPQVATAGREEVDYIGRLQGLTSASNWSVPSIPKTVDANSTKTQVSAKPTYHHYYHFYLQFGGIHHPPWRNMGKYDFAVISKCYILDSSEFLIYQKLNMRTENTFSFSTATQGFHLHNFRHSQLEIF